MGKSASFALTALGAGVASALLFSLILVDSPLGIILSPFSMMPLLMVGLGLGFGPVLLAGAGATALIGTLGGAIAAFLFVVVEAVPAIALSRQALVRRPVAGGDAEWYPVGRLVAMAAAYAAALFLIALAWFSGEQGGLRGVIERLLSGELAGLAPSPGQGGSAAASEARAFARASAGLVPATIGAWWLILVMANLAAGQALLARLGKSRRPSLRLSTMELPRWLALATLAAAALGLVTSGQAGLAGWTLAAIFAVPFFFVGMVVVHAMCRNWGPGWLFVTSFYLLLLFRGWPALIAVALGLVDQWLKLRVRIAGPQTT